MITPFASKMVIHFFCNELMTLISFQFCSAGWFSVGVAQNMVDLEYIFELSSKFVNNFSANHRFQTNLKVVSAFDIKMGKDYLGKDMRRGAAEEKEEEKEIKALDEGDIQLLKTYGQGPYSKSLKQVEQDIAETIKKVNELAGIKVIIKFSLHICDSDQIYIFL